MKKSLLLILIAFCVFSTMFIFSGCGPENLTSEEALKKYGSKIRENCLQLASKLENLDLIYDAGKTNIENVYSENPVKDKDGNEYKYSFDVYYMSTTYEQQQVRFSMVVGYKDIEAIKHKNGVLLRYESIDSNKHRNNLSPEDDAYNFE